MLSAATLVSIAEAVLAVAQAAPTIVNDVENLLMPLLEGREPTDEEWQAIQAAIATKDAELQANALAVDGTTEAE